LPNELRRSVVTKFFLNTVLQRFQFVGGRIRLLFYPQITTQALLDEVVVSVHSVSLHHLQHEAFDKSGDNPSIIYSLYPGDQIWESPKQTFATPFIQSIATRNIFTNHLKDRTDFLSNIYNANIASPFLG
jgi:hypothetical protein